MVRAAVLSIVLTLAGGPNAFLLCETFCLTAAAGNGCHHEAPVTSPSLANEDRCDDVVLSAIFLREDVRGVVSVPNSERAIPVLPYQLARPASLARPDHEPGREWSLDKRPLPSVLRL